VTASAPELVAAAEQRRPYDIVRSAYGELVVSDLAVSERFYVDLLGLVVSARTDDRLYLRGWEERSHHSLVLRSGSTAAAARVAFRVRSPEDLSKLADEFDGRGYTVSRVEGEHVGMGSAVRVWDPFGFPLEFFSEMEQLDTLLQRFDVQRGAPIMRFDHFNLHTPQLEQALAFWQDLGFRCTEYIATDDDERIVFACVTRKATVHDVALSAGRGPRLHHLGFAVAEPAAVLRVCDQLAAAGYTHAIERGPGRHGATNAFFLYLRDPDGHRIELYTGDYYTGDPDLKPRRWSLSDPNCRSFWGTPAPDSWYQESSVVLTSSGSVGGVVDATIDEQSIRSELMA
jgi:catechol 2,3-dioxygenase